MRHHDLVRTLFLWSVVYFASILSLAAQTEGTISKRIPVPQLPYQAVSFTIVSETSNFDKTDIVLFKPNNGEFGAPVVSSSDKFHLTIESEAKKPQNAVGERTVTVLDRATGEQKWSQTMTFTGAAPEISSIGALVNGKRSDTLRITNGYETKAILVIEGGPFYIGSTVTFDPASAISVDAANAKVSVRRIEVPISMQAKGPSSGSYPFSVRHDYADPVVGSLYINNVTPKPNVKGIYALVGGQRADTITVEDGKDVNGIMVIEGENFLPGSTISAGDPIIKLHGTPDIPSGSRITIPFTLAPGTGLDSGRFAINIASNFGDGAFTWLPVRNVTPRVPPEQARLIVGGTFDLRDKIDFNNWYTDLSFALPYFVRNGYGPFESWGIRLDASTGSTIGKPDTSSFTFSTPITIRDTILSTSTEGRSDTVISAKEYARHDSTFTSSSASTIAAGLTVVTTLLPHLDLHLRLSFVHTERTRDYTSQRYRYLLQPRGELAADGPPLAFHSSVDEDVWSLGVGLSYRHTIFGSTIETQFYAGPSTTPRFRQEMFQMFYDFRWNILVGNNVLALGGFVRGFGNDQPDVLIYLGKVVTLDALKSLFGS